MDQERIEAERFVLERKCEEQERQFMDQERIEAELERSVELERQRVERERTEKARRRTGCDAGRQCRSVGASPCRRGGAGAARERRSSKKAGAKRRGVMTEPVTWKPRGTVKSKKP